jgi:hypothetical protein
MICRQSAHPFWPGTTRAQRCRHATFATLAARPCWRDAEACCAQHWSCVVHSLASFRQPDASVPAVHLNCDGSVVVAHCAGSCSMTISPMSALFARCGGGSPSPNSYVVPNCRSSRDQPHHETAITLTRHEHHGTGCHICRNDRGAEPAALAQLEADHCISAVSCSASKADKLASVTSANSKVSIWSASRARRELVLDASNRTDMSAGGLEALQTVKVTPSNVMTGLTWWLCM